MERLQDDIPRQPAEPVTQLSLEKMRAHRERLDGALADALMLGSRQRPIRVRLDILMAEGPPPEANPPQAA